MGRFDYIKYNNESLEIQLIAKKQCENLEELIELSLNSSRYKKLALTKLEEVYMWIGKAIRDDQIEKIPKSLHQEERSNS
jgi:hypothetical protein